MMDKFQREMRKARRKRLLDRLKALRERSNLLESELVGYLNDFYRVCIFGSARISEQDSIYQSTFKLAQGLGELGIDVLTGGGPGLMDAANRGVISGKQKSGSKSKSYGITVSLNIFEPPGEHIDIRHHHRRFSSRLDDFMRLSNAIVIVRGGIGTLLELFYSWQLVQVKHMPPRPIILMDSRFWDGIIQWMKDIQLAQGLISKNDFDYIKIVDEPEEVIKIIKEDYETFLKNKDY